MNRRIATWIVVSATSFFAASASAQSVPVDACAAGEETYEGRDPVMGLARCIAELGALDCRTSGRCGDLTRLPCVSEEPSPGEVVFVCRACAPLVNINVRRDLISRESSRREACTGSPTAGGGGGGTNPPEDCELTATPDTCYNSPIIFDLGDRGYDLTSVAKGVEFDIDADGAREHVAWTARGSDDAFLARDRNGNGQIDDGNELFGNRTKLANGKTGAHGYIPLAELDLISNGGNGNGYVDSADRDFVTLLLWTDRDHNGRSSSSELMPLAVRGIFAISLDADERDVFDEHGNHLAFVSPAYAMSGFRTERIRTTDVFFRYRELAR